MMKLTLWRVPMRSCAACSAEAVQDQIIVRSSRKVTTEIVTPSSVRNVRSLFRRTLRTAMVPRPMGTPHRSGGEHALVEAVDRLRAFGGGRIVRDHHDRLPELRVELLEQLQDF